MSSLNKVQLIGRMGKDPEQRTTTTGTTVTNFTLATSEKYNGEEKTEWHNIVAFKKAAELIAQYCSKGSQIYVEGKIQTRKWQDKDNNTRYSTEIIVFNFLFLDGKREAQDPTESQYNSTQSMPDSGISDSEIPF